MGDKFERDCVSLSWLTEDLLQAAKRGDCGMSATNTIVIEVAARRLTEILSILSAQKKAA